MSRRRRSNPPASRLSGSFDSQSVHVHERPSRPFFAQRLPARRVRGEGDRVRFQKCGAAARPSTSPSTSRLIFSNRAWPCAKSCLGASAPASAAQALTLWVTVQLCLLGPAGLSASGFEADQNAEFLLFPVLRSRGLRIVLVEADRSRNRDSLVDAAWSASLDSER